VGLTGDGELKLPHGIQVAHADAFLIEQALQEAAVSALKQRFASHNACVISNPARGGRA
jgi:hypothetical protein